MNTLLGAIQDVLRVAFGLGEVKLAKKATKAAERRCARAQLDSYRLKARWNPRKKGGKGEVITTTVFLVIVAAGILIAVLR